MVTLAHLISIIHLHPPRCCFFFFKSLFFSYKNTCSCTHTHRPLHILRTHTSKTHRKPSAYAMQQRGQEQGVNSRESGRGVGGVWEDHMHFTRDWWKHMLTHLITHSIVTLRKKINKKNKTKQTKTIYQSLSFAFLCIPVSHTQPCRKSCVG